MDHSQSSRRRRHPAPFYASLPRMSHAHDLFAREDCVTCGATPSCDCPAHTQCQLTGRTCQQCPQIQCIPTGGSSGSGVNPGVVAGPVVAVLVLVSVGLFWWLRRKRRRDLARLEDLARQAKAESLNLQLGRSGANSPVPLSAHSSHLAHPSALPQAEYYDADGALVRVYGGTRGVIDLRTEKSPVGGGGGPNPFDDRHSASSKATSQSDSTHVIPIQYATPPAETQTDRSRLAAQKLTEARANLLQPRRPARSPDLDLRLNPPATSGQSLSARDLVPGRRAGARESYHSETSAAPSFMTGMTGLTGVTDLHAEAPRIVTSRQVQVGRLQQAEVVRLGGVTPALGSGGARHPETLQDSARASGLTFGPLSIGDGAERQKYTTGEIADADELAAPAFPAQGDMRFSLSSLAYRDSVSSMGTTSGPFAAVGTSAGGMPASPFSDPTEAAARAGPRESIFSTHSTRSAADSFLSAFPMIPPGHPAARALLGPNGLPQSTSVATLDHAHGMGTGGARGGGGSMPASVSSGSVGLSLTQGLEGRTGARPPTSFRAVGPSGLGGAQSGGTGMGRPLTAFSTQSGLSVADSLLGSFPFIPPRGAGADGVYSTQGNGARAGAREDGTEEMVLTPLEARQDGQPTSAGQGKDEERRAKGRLTLGLSTTSEGLGGFDFAFPVPPVPGPSSRAGP